MDNTKNHTGAGLRLAEAIAAERIAGSPVAADVGGLTRQGLKADPDGAPYVGPRIDGDYYKASDVERLLATKAAAQAPPQQAVPEGDSVQAHVMPPFAAPAGQHEASRAADDQWIFDLAADHETRGNGLYGPVTFSATGLANFAHTIEALVASRCRAQGGITSEESGSNLAHVARQPAAATAERAAINELLTRIDDANENYERFGQVCEFEGHPMIYASTLHEIIELRGKAHVASLAAPSPAAAQEGEQGSKQTEVVKVLQRALESALDQGSAQAAPADLRDAGWPAEPTPEMQQAGASAIRFNTTVLNKIWTANAVYRAMREAVLNRTPADDSQKGGV